MASEDPRDLTAGAPPHSSVLRERCGDIIVVPGDPAYDDARVPWNVAVDQRPAAVGIPRTVEDVQTIVGAAAALGMQVAAQTTGHAAAVLAEHELGNAVLLRTHELAQVAIDPERRIAHIGGGVIWQPVVEAAAQHGLAAQHGSSPDVGVAGYLLGGGLSWYARAKGLATNDVVAVELVTADGSLIRASADEHEELFWALRGGGGNFGVITSIELKLHRIPDVYAGLMLWDIQHLEPVLRHWVKWAQEAPDEVTTSLRALRFPPLPDLPPFLQGRHLVVVDGAFIGDDDAGASLLAGFRELTPEMDTWTRTPAEGLTALHMDPPGPTPSVGVGTLLFDLDEAGIQAFIDAVGPAAQTSLLAAELRQLGGAASRPVPGGGVVNRIDAAYAGFFVAVAATPEMAEAGRADGERARSALAAWETGRTFLNLMDEAVDVQTAYGHDALVRLSQLREQVDPDGVMLANHAVPGA
ncbi:MAG: FAD-binding oxidoreductase [Candidatus Nanopelagicales bacterium]